MSRRCNAIVHPLPKGSKECKTVEDYMHERWYKKHRARLQAIRERGNTIPGPNEAKHAMKMMEKERLQARERRLMEQELETRINQRLNNEMMKRVCLAQEKGKIDNHWDKRFMKEWSTVRKKYEEARQEEEQRNFRLMCDILKKRKAAMSEYRREVVESDWKPLLKKMYKDVRFPCSDWWNEYLHCVAGKRQRRPPPYPVLSSCDYLDQFEDCYRDYLDELCQHTWNQHGLDPSDAQRK